MERFTERARRVMVLATEEARCRRHGAVGPAHLLMAILRDGGTLGGKKLQHLRVSPERLAVEVERVLSETPESAVAGEPAFAPELKAVLEATLDEQRRCLYAVDPQDLLRGLLADDRSTACRILGAAGADLDQARLLTRLSFGDPLTVGDVRFIATSKWRLEISRNSVRRSLLFRLANPISASRHARLASAGQPRSTRGYSIEGSLGHSPA